MNEIELLVELHKEAERQGPGSTQDTMKALDLMKVSKYDESLKVADIGCGTGGQTLTIAENINGTVLAIDMFPQFLEVLNMRAEKYGLSDRIKTLNRSMDDLSFEEDEFDIIWSEGAIYIMGFQKGIQAWRRYLKTGGYLAVSEVTWITPSRPKEIEAFWQNEYPEIGTASEKFKQLEETGYTPYGYFYLSQNSWLENYYQPLEERFSSFLEQHHYSDLAKRVVDEHREEIRMYRKYKEYYSYGFYIAKKL